MLLKLLTIAVTICFITVDCKLSSPRTKFIRGRPIDGFVRKPPTTNFVGYSDNIITANFTQKLDHFNATDNRTWQQMYQMNQDAWKAGGPMFVYISGEAPAELKWMTSGQWVKNGKLYGALMFQLEHRFFGQSQPLSDASDANLVYLTSDQALADLDDFIKAMMVQHEVDKVIVFGGSYAGAMAAWYMSKYSTAIGAIASSGPVTAERDFTQYLETVGSTLDYFVPNCSQLVNEAFSSLQQLIANGDTTTVGRLFNPCKKPLDNSDPYDVSSFFDEMINMVWAEAVQYTQPDNANSEVFEMCNYMMNETIGDPIDRLSAIYQDIFETPDQTCIPHDYDEYVANMKQTAYTDPWVAAGTRQWTWLTCNEFGYFQSTDSDNQPFGNLYNISFMIDVDCTRVFGLTFDQVGASVDNTNINRGGVNGKEKNTYLPNGSLDPWHNLAIIDSPPDPSDILGFMTGTSHCYDMYDDKDTDPPQLIQTRYEITQQIGIWLQGPTTGPTTGGTGHVKHCLIFIVFSLFACLFPHARI